MSSALAATVDAVLAEIDAKANPYFTALASGELSKDDFIETQLQFHSAVVFFSRPMAALVAKIPEAALRVEIVRNVWEEHGEGEVHAMHGQTFVTFLSRLMHIPREDVEKTLATRALWPEIRAFNTALSGACVLDDYLVGAAVLGIIERMFVEIASWLGRGVVARGWLKPEEMIHYNLHERLDTKHAQDFFDVLEPVWHRSADARYNIEQGLRMGALLFDQLYARLYRSRARRLMK